MRPVLLGLFALVACEDHARPSGTEGCGRHAIAWESTAQCTCDEGFDWCMERGDYVEGPIAIGGLDCCPVGPMPDLRVQVDQIWLWPWNRAFGEAYSAEEPDGRSGNRNLIAELEAVCDQNPAMSTGDVLSRVRDIYPALLTDPGLLPDVKSIAALPDGEVVFRSELALDTLQPPFVDAETSDGGMQVLVWQPAASEEVVGGLVLEELELGVLLDEGPTVLGPTLDLLGARVTVSRAP